MKKINRIHLLGIIILATMMLPQISAAASFTIGVNNLVNPSGINSVAFWFNVGDDFQFLSPDAASTVGEAVPPGGTVGWVPTVEHVTETAIDMFKIDALDMDDALGLGGQNLQNGTIFDFLYSGSIIDFARVEFGVGSTNIFGTDIVLTSFDASAGWANFSTVPIPAAVWMLGTGLLGLVAIRRRSAKA